MRFLERTAYIINLTEIESRREEYEGLEQPDWLQSMSEPWLIVPLLRNGELLGFVVLCDPLNPWVINWEDRDLLKTAANQVSSYLAAVSGLHG